MSVSQGMRFRLINLMYCTTVISRELFGAGSLLNESCKEYFCKVTGQKKWFRKLPTQKKIHDENSCTFLADSSERKRAKQKQCVLCVLHTGWQQTVACAEKKTTQKATRICGDFTHTVQQPPYKNDIGLLSHLSFLAPKGKLLNWRVRPIGDLMERVET